ncbi:B12-binding domain-containing radical SAM protein [Brevibacillus daliensis]|uniref:B12-binding domain-containing radical SAM protein n=1 Tax=Brevibacillus daliensis TaxID=2892995 RepID=UPI001E2F5DE6|nr:B12-binding domain-containing radical SAM protein [Brevibacillus daliensis]
MKIVLTTLNAKFIHSSLALRLLRSYTKPHYPDIELVEYTINDLMINIVGDIYKRKPDLLAFSVYIWNIRETLDVISNIKKICPDIPIVLGGPEVSYDTDHWMRNHKDIDVIVMGEGEAAFLDLCNTYNEARQTGNPPTLSNVEGIAYRDGERVRFSMQREQMKDLNVIPSPFEDNLDELTNRVVYYEASRGCPFRCQYCLSSLEKGVRYFEIDRVKTELKRLIDHGVKTIKFIDRTFNINKQYAMEIFQFLIDNHNGTIFQFEITADILKPDVVDFLAENAPPGIFRFEIGVQSTNDETNRIVERRQNFEKLSYTVKKIKESGKIVQHLDLIAGLPEEDYQSFRNTFNDVFALRPEELQLGFLKMLRGTGVRMRAQDHGYVYMDQAPYEILGNNVLPFEDMRRIRRTEDILEKYWNDHRMDETLEWILPRHFESAFDFFQEFGNYWEAQGWGRLGHQLEDLYTRLDKFLEAKGVSNKEHALSMMKYDYLRQQRYRPRKIWWDDHVGKSRLKEIYSEVAERREALREDFRESARTEKEYAKHTTVAHVSFDIELFERTGEVVEGEYALVMYYSFKEDVPNTFVCVALPNTAA